MCDGSREAALGGRAGRMMTFLPVAATLLVYAVAAASGCYLFPSGKGPDAFR